MKQIRSAKVRGHRWRIAWESPDDDYGECDYDNHTITINPKLDPAATVDTMIHEFLHATFPDLCEETVNQAATEISDMLDRAHLIAED